MIGLQEMSGVASPPPLSPLLNRPLKKVNRLIDSSNRLIRVPVRRTQSLKVVCNEKGGWTGRWQTLAIGLGPWRSRFLSRLFLMSSLILNYFRFHPSKPQFIGNDLMNGQKICEIKSLKIIDAANLDRIAY
jgi:hypothetical protein